MPAIEVVRKAEPPVGQSTTVILREEAFKAASCSPGQRSPAESFPTATTTAKGSRPMFLISGHLRLEFGPKWEKAVELHPWCFFLIPRGSYTET